ncbi:TetR/AcrR family transcriptional regulator [Actinophytocola gossypii]|uniref:TetR/AcrR family transcriptional regulator n=1 Tax=Actinophytocola gossypii TaxID=2812003 RepID=A0ABT2JAB5_9PSEU|nr:TetR/AcrR family transcriptional regulator [Actinophytocola gossypii]MCT2584819.1 TetR/AcrR family transcriptional regulator [Actinophytocola gossypii]
MARSIRRHLDEEILDRAAGLFARHGFDHTSLKDLADAVELSKPGLLHHYPSKEALFAAAMAMGRRQGQEVLERATRVPPGQERDRRAVELLVDFALERPGLIALASRGISTLGDGADLDVDDPDESRFSGIEQPVLAALGVEPTSPGDDPERLVRVVGMLAALAVLSLSANHVNEKAAWRPHIITTCLDALGHHGRGGAPTDPAQVEA